MSPDFIRKLKTFFTILAPIISLLVLLNLLYSWREHPFINIGAIIICLLGVWLFSHRKDYLPKKYTDYKLSYLKHDYELDVVIELMINYFGPDYNPSKDVIKSWLHIEPNIIRLLSIDSPNPHICGFYCLLCIKQNTMNQIVNNIINDWTLDNSFIVPYKNAGQEELLYAMYLVVDKVSRNHASVLLTDLQKIVEQIASERSGLSKIATITSTPNGEKLVKRNKFSLINELHFPHGWKYWERSIFNDQ